MKTAFLFPGQGSQSAGMMAAFADNAAVRETFAEAGDMLQQDLWDMQTTGAGIDDTVNTQPLMLTAGVAVWRAYLAAGGAKPDALAGHSLGEYTALVAAGSLNFADAVRIVRLRAELMQRAVPAGEGAMAAVLGAEDEAVRRLCAAAAENQTVEAVNFNSPGQIVIAGHAAAVARAVAQAAQYGAKRAVPLPVSVPAHSSLMRPAAAELAAALEKTPLAPPAVPVWQNADAAAHSDTAAVRDALVRQLYSPVRWSETVAALIDSGTERFAECAPGKVLAGLNRRISKACPCAALDTPAAVADFAAQA